MRAAVRRMLLAGVFLPGDHCNHHWVDFRWGETRLSEMVTWVALVFGEWTSEVLH